MDVAVGSRCVAPEANRPHHPRHPPHHDVDGRAIDRHQRQIRHRAGSTRREAVHGLWCGNQPRGWSLRRPRTAFRASVFRKADPLVGPAGLGRARRQAAGAERYSRRLSERITDGYASKFDRHADQGGHAGLGFRRSPERLHVLEVDPDTIGRAVALFERYALGDVSAKDLAEESGFAESRIRMILMNPTYNGWIRRYFRSRNETRKPVPWRSNPPVSDELWARVEDVRRHKTRAGGPRRADRVDLLKGLIECVCGRRVRSDGTFADGRHRKLHVNPCAEWGKRARLGDEVWGGADLAQLEGIVLDHATISAVVASLGSGHLR